MRKLIDLFRDKDGNVNVGMLIGMVIFVLIAALLYPLIQTQVDDLSNSTEGAPDYVGEDAEPMVDMIPIFYWLAIALVVIGVAIYAVKDSL